MKILGISGSPRKDETSGTYRLVTTVLQATGCDYELVALGGKKISGCIACLRCVKDNVCKVDNFIETVAKVSGQGAASCYSCGYGETCKVGIPYFLHGEGVKITPATVPNVTRQAAVMQAAIDAGKLLGQRLREGHDRTRVTLRMQQVMMDQFQASA